MLLFKDGLEIPEHMMRCLEHDLVDVEEWIRSAIFGKGNSCYKRIRSEWVDRLIADPNIETIASGQDEFLDQVLAHPDYRNRVDRDIEEVEGNN